MFGKYALIDKNLKLSLIAQVDLPTSTRDAATGLSTGVGALSFQPKLSVGGGTSKWHYFGYFGYGMRSNDFHDFLHFGTEVGRRLNDKLIIMLHAQRLHNLNNGDSSVDTPANIETGLYTSFQEYSAMELKIFAEDLYKGFGGFLSGGGSFLGSLVSVAASPAISIGVFYKW